MKKILFVLGLIMLTKTVYTQAPSIEWQKTFGGSSYDQGYDYKATLDGGYILVGSTTSTNGDVTGWHSNIQGYADVWIVKIDANKNLVWQKCYGGSRSDGGVKVLQLPDSGYIVMCMTYSTDGDLAGLKTTTDAQLWLLRISKTGNIIWSKLTTGYQAYDLSEIDNKYYFVEAWNSGGSGVATIDTSGNIAYKKGFSGNLSFGTYAQKIIKTYDKGYIVAGSSTLTSIGSISNNGSSDVYLCKMDSNFNVKWQNLIGTSYNDGASDILQTSDSGYLVGGYTLLATGSTLSGHHGDYDYCITKVDKNGQKQWSKYYGGSDEDKLIGLIQDNNGYIIYGTTESRDGDVTGYHGVFINKDMWMIKIDSFSGNLIWGNTYGSSYFDAAYNIKKDTDSTLLFCGVAGFNDGDVSTIYGDDVWFGRFNVNKPLPLKLLSFNAKQQTRNVVLNWQTANEVNVSHINIQRSINGKDFTSIGKVNASCCEYSYTDNSLPSTVDSKLYYRLEIIDKDGSKTYSSVNSVQLKVNSEIKLYPNPSNGNVTIECAGAKELLIIDYLGRTVKQFQVYSEELIVNTKQFPKGSYIVKATLKNGDVVTEKLVVE